MHSRKITITIDADFGSSFQCNTIMNLLPTMVKSIAEVSNAQHAKNKITIRPIEWEATP